MWRNIVNVTSLAGHGFACTWLSQFIFSFVCSAPTTRLYLLLQKGFVSLGHRHFHMLFLLSHINTCLSWVSSSVLTSSEKRRFNFLAQQDSPIICGSDSEESACNAGDLGFIPGLGRSLRGGHGNPLQYYCLENPMDRGAWWATVHGVTKSQTRLSNWTTTARRIKKRKR